GARGRPRPVRPDPGRPALQLHRLRAARPAHRSPARPRRARRPPDARRPGARAGRPPRTYVPQVRLRAAYPIRAVITPICPGSYDPVTNGHLDVIQRAAKIFDRVVVGVVGNPQHKTTLIPVEERVELIREAVASTPNVEVDVFKELVVEFARRWEA